MRGKDSLENHFTSNESPFFDGKLHSQTSAGGNPRRRFKNNQNNIGPKQQEGNIKSERKIMQIVRD